MSTRQRKCCGEPVDSRQARKRRRLVTSNTGGDSEAEPVDPRESAVEEAVDLTDRSSEPEVSDLTDDNSVVQWQQSQQYPRFFRAADNSAVLLMSDNEEEQGDYDDIWPAGPASSLFWVDEDSELLEEYEQQRRNVTLRSQRQSDSSVLGSNEEDEAIDDDVAWPAGTIRCPICMDFYSEILQSERLFLSTQCGHVFCSQCLPVALETANTCPICRTELTHEQYHSIYI
ncbi:E3 ubiquitin-protein ligase RNF4-like [Chiroxiphia lanceolata]|uniref:E3 ubiquitin-protein ligase RNF4-like n=1 Tax=Chiroxiphia lanceolata TaxID=296741 RepID=UPI0013CEC1F6|nr:E3 ubiquitin-protein ligase RNF4-like [Chiroxiphia lanceolata]XP_032542448.1 E3 ubiquitin-protein ligase RNF4-like [Chiroxiphia lanceolata]